jgi:hypothetical protein
LSGTRPKTLLFGTICSVLFAVGLVWLFWMRFQAGDLYPAYSSLRGDPLGTQVLYESLRNTDAYGATRNFSPLDQAKPAAGDTFLVCGLTGAEGFLDARMWQPLLDRIARDGGRLIITFTPAVRRGKRAPATARPAKENPNDAHKDENGADHGTGGDGPARTGNSTPGSGPAAGTKPERPEWTGVMTQLAVALKNVEAQGAAFANTARRAPMAYTALPGRIPWRAPLYFDLQDPAWHAVYVWEDRPVIVQRSWGRGSVIMSSDSYLFSNEALRRDRQPALLAWMIRPSGRVTVDELHNGLVQRPGIAGLMRKYRLEGMVACLVALAVFMIWRQAAVFAPRPADLRNKDRREGVGSSVDGWTGLMRQHIHPKDLLRTGHQAWRGSAVAARVPEERMAQVTKLIEACDADPRRYPPVSVYRSICELLGGGLKSASRPRHHAKAEREDG